MHDLTDNTHMFQAEKVSYALNATKSYKKWLQNTKLIIVLHAKLKLHRTGHSDIVTAMNTFGHETYCQLLNLQ